MACHGNTVMNYGCSSHSCAPQGTTLNPRAVTSWTISVEPGQYLRIGVITQLRTALNTELSIRSLAAVSWTSTAANQKTRKPVLDQLVNAVNSCRTKDGGAAFTWATRNIGEKVTSTLLKQLRQNTNTLQKVCVCNCNYCTCNCNYCPCDCNYTCTCECNYSDERLKDNIQYIEG